jgi:hypothetical protein
VHTGGDGTVVGGGGAVAGGEATGGAVGAGEVAAFGVGVVSTGVVDAVGGAVVEGVVDAGLEGATLVGAVGVTASAVEWAAFVDRACTINATPAIAPRRRTVSNAIDHDRPWSTCRLPPTLPEAGPSSLSVASVHPAPVQRLRPDHSAPVQ